MTGISTIGQFQRIKTDMLRTQERLLELQIQSTTGKKGTTFGDIGADARRSLNVRAASNQIENFRRNIDVVETRAGVMDTALGRLSSLLNELRNEYTKVSGNINDNNTTFLNELGRRGLAEIANILNTRLDGRYLFAGDDIDRRDDPPMLDPAALITRFETLIGEYRTGGVDGTAVVAAMNAAVNDPARAYDPIPTGFTLTPAPAAPPATASVDAAPIFRGSLFYSGNGPRARVDRDYDVEYGIRADLPVFRDIVQAFAIAATVRYERTEDADYRAIVDAGQRLTLNSIPNLNNEIGKLGLTRKEMIALKTKHADVNTYFEREIGQIEDVDMAEVFTRIQQTQVVLQATYRITAGLQDLSLLNFLR